MFTSNNVLGSLLLQVVILDKTCSELAFISFKPILLRPFLWLQFLGISGRIFCKESDAPEQNEKMSSPARHKGRKADTSLSASLSMSQASLPKGKSFLGDSGVIFLIIKHQSWWTRVLMPKCHSKARHEPSRIRNFHKTAPCSVSWRVINKSLKRWHFLRYTMSMYIAIRA